MRVMLSFSFPAHFQREATVRVDATIEKVFRAYFSARVKQLDATGDRQKTDQAFHEAAAFIRQTFPEWEDPNRERWEARLTRLA